MHDKLKLMELLTNKDIDLGIRDDAAMDLAHFSDDDVLELLYKVAADPMEDHMILESCGESIGEILISKDQLIAKYLLLLTPTAYREAYFVIKRERPEWIERLIRSE